MEELMPITNINDFLFCPRSLYFGNIYRRSIGKDDYQEAPQKIGTAAHTSLDESTYSTRKNIMTGTMVHCATFGLLGRIDSFDVSRGLLMERKWSVSDVWEGYRMQLYAQAKALQEMGYEVKALKLHSKKNNRTFDVALPTARDWARLAEIIAKMRKFRLDAPFAANPRKCARCIYSGLCDECEAKEAS